MSPNEPNAPSPSIATQPLKVRAATEDLCDQLAKARAKIAEIEGDNKKLAEKYAFVLANKSRLAEQLSKTKADTKAVLASASKEKEGIVRQVDNFRAKIQEFEANARVATLRKFQKYIDAKGYATDLVPDGIRGQDDWIGALIVDHNAWVVSQKKGEWGGLLSEHAKAPVLANGCNCPVCNLWHEITVLRGAVYKLRNENKEYQDELREHRKAAGPVSEKAKAKMAAEAKALEDATAAAEKMAKELATAKKKLADVEAALAREKDRRKTPLPPSPHKEHPGA